MKEKNMRRSCLVLLLLIASSARSQDAPKPEEPSQAPPQFPAQIEQVTVDVVVVDKKGAPVTDLKAADFTVTEDGVPQSISSFEAVRLPATPSETPAERPRVSTNVEVPGHEGRAFVIVFDDVHLTRADGIRAKVAIAEFLKTGVREGDRVTLLSTAGDAWWTARMEAGREELMTILKHLEGRNFPDIAPDRMSEYEAMRIQVYNDQEVANRVMRRFEQMGVTQFQQTSSQSKNNDMRDPEIWARASEVYFQSVARNRATLNLIERALAPLASTKGRKAVILVSDGFIYDSNLEGFKKVVQASRRANAAIYYMECSGLQALPIGMSAEFGGVMDASDVGGGLLDGALASDGSNSLASDSGGFTVRNTNDLTRGIERIALESQTYYLLGYSPTNGKRDGKFRKIDVKVARKGIDIRARKGYYAPSDEKEAPRKPGGVDPDLQRALDSPYDLPQIPLRMTAYVQDESMLGKATTFVVAEVDIKDFTFVEREGRLTDAIEFLMVTAHRESGEYFRYDQSVDMKLLPATRDKLRETWFGISREFELAAGGYQAKIVVREKNTGRIGTVIHDFEVPDLTQFRVSSVTLSDTLQPNPEGAKAVPHATLLARRSFKAGSELFAQFAVFGAAKGKDNGMPKVTAGSIIRSADGTVHSRLAPSLITPTSLGKLTRLLGSRLDDYPPGPYEFVLDVHDEVADKVIEIREPFTVEGPGPTASR